MAMTELEQHYNKFNEEKRLDSRHGRVEFITSMKYIHNCLDDIKAAMDIASDIKILDIGAGTVQKAKTKRFLRHIRQKKGSNSSSINHYPSFGQ